MTMEFLEGPTVKLKMEKVRVGIALSSESGERSRPSSLHQRENKLSSQEFP